MLDVLLCIDDDPLRYDELAQIVAPHVLLVIHDDPEMVGLVLNHYQDRLIGVCLDHDMRVINGQQMARHYLIDRTLRVAITSANPVGSRQIEALLNEYEVECRRLSAAVSSTNRAQYPDGWAMAVAEYLDLFRHKGPAHPR